MVATASRIGGDMKVIIIEDSVYKVTEKQYVAIKEVESSLSDDFDLEARLNDFLQDNIKDYIWVGSIHFQFRL